MHLITNISVGSKVSDSTSSTAIQGYIEKVGGPINTIDISNQGQVTSKELLIMSHCLR